MPMIDVYATAGTFADQHEPAADLATTVRVIEGVPASMPHAFYTRSASCSSRHSPAPSGAESHLCPWASTDFAAS